MAYNLQRLIELAKKTGDRLIIHDPVQGQDIVLLGIDAYEELVLGKPAAPTQPSASPNFFEEFTQEPEETAPLLPSRPPQEGEWFHTKDIFEERFKAQRPVQIDGGGMHDEEVDFPLSHHMPEDIRGGQDEESLGDEEPVFLEEPV